VLGISFLLCGIGFGGTGISGSMDTRRPIVMPMAILRKKKPITMSKEEILNFIYFDTAGYGSRKQTYDEAKKKDKTITMKDVKYFIDKHVSFYEDTKDDFLVSHSISKEE
jgi:hypothetical protein